MGEIFSRTPEFESEPALDKGAVLDKLFELRDELGIDISEEDLEALLGEDDNDFLGNLATLALMHGQDHEEFFDRLGIPVELRPENG